MTTGRTPGQRAGITRDAVMAAASRLINEGGAEALTMRALAGRLGVAPNALYSHVENKTQLLDQLLDDLLAGVQAPAADSADPIRALREMMSSTYDVLTSAPTLLPLFLARQGARGPYAVRLGELMDAFFVRAGLSGAAVARARRVLIIHTIGSAAFAVSAPVAPKGDRPLPMSESRRSFDQGLRWLLAGIMQSVAGEEGFEPSVS